MVNEKPLRACYLHFMYEYCTARIERELFPIVSC